MDDTEFTSDGCSGGMTVIWQFLFNKLPPWNGVCVEHDRAYSRGGTANDRRIADAELLAGVAHNGHPVWAIIMWIAVRIGGHPYFPFSWRWGYRHQYPCRYAERTN
jgi:hypothetical protein